MMIVAHRGASKQAPENTFAAFELAYEAGADAIETDVHLTKDSVPIIMHDETVNRTTNGRGYIQDYTYEQLKRLNANAQFNQYYTKERIPTLEQLLQWAVDKEILLNIELKNNKIDYNHLEKIVYDLICKYKMKERIILSSFNPKSIKRLQAYKEELEIAYLTSNHKHLINRAKDLGIKSLHLKHSIINKKLMTACQQNKLIVRAYTVNKSSHIKRILDLQCQGIITDMPGEVRLAMNAYEKLKD